MSSEMAPALKEETPKEKPIRLKTSQGFTNFLRTTLGTFLRLSYNIKGENLEVVNDLAPPYILLPNHQMFWDPFILNYFIKYPVYYVTSDMQFRSKILSALLSLVGAIPKSKFISDFETIRLIMQVKKKNGVIGVYPEGRRSWDGHTLKLVYSTAKLVKLLKVPVVVPLMRGGFLSLPRWSSRRRKGEVTISFSIGLTPEEISALSVEEIYQKLTDLLSYDEYDFQKKAMIPFLNKKRAEYLELALFVCPHCKALSSLESRGAVLTCSACNYSVHYNQYGFFEGVAGPAYFQTLREWNLWQLDYFKKLLEKRTEEKSEEPILIDKRIWIKLGFRKRPLKKYHFGNMILYYDRIEFHTLKGKTLVFPMDKIDGENVQTKERLEFYCEGKLYHFRPLNKRVSGYKYSNAISILQGHGPVQ